MTSQIDAVGDAVTGLLIVSAVESEIRGTCLNCGAARVGPYCHVCGQDAHLHRTIVSFVHDLLHGVFHFEGKFWQTLPMLVLKPGELTRRYIAGERAKFVSPLAMFLFCTFLMFAVVGSLAGEIHAPAIDPAIAEAAKQNQKEIEQNISSEQSALGKLRLQIADLEKVNGDAKALLFQAQGLEKDIAGLQTARKVVAGVAGVTAGTSWGETGTAIGKEWEQAGKATGKELAGSKDFQLLGGIDTGWPALDRGINSANENPNLFLYRLQTSAYKYSWLLIPISTPMVWLLFFWKRQYKFYDHLVFVTFSLTFMLLLVSVLVIAGAIGVSQAIVTPAAMIIPPIHIYKQMRDAYASGWITTLIRTFLLIVFGFIALAIYLIILMALGVTH